jgi:hypothetical protein
MTKYKLTEEVVKEAANFMAKAAQLTLQAKHTRTAIRAKWKKVGQSWEPDGPPMKQKFRANYVSSGNLVRSIKPIADGLEFGIEFDSYGQRHNRRKAAIRKKQRRKGHTTKRIKRVDEDEKTSPKKPIKRAVYKKHRIQSQGNELHD